MTEEPMLEPIDQAWKRLFIEHIIRRSGVGMDAALMEYEALIDGDQEWDDMTPEEAADECMSYWDDDGNE